MSNESGEKLLVKEVESALGKSPSVEEVIALLMRGGVIEPRKARAYIAREQMRRRWDASGGRLRITEACREVGILLDLSPSTIHDHFIAMSLSR